jgi:hypothetical protein
MGSRINNPLISGLSAGSRLAPSASSALLVTPLPASLSRALPSSRAEIKRERCAEALTGWDRSKLQRKRKTQLGGPRHALLGGGSST